jgi:hypothetical protein
VLQEKGADHYAGKISTWGVLGSMHLSAKSVPSESISKEVDFDTFFAIVDEFPIQSLEKILYETIQTESPVRLRPLAGSRSRT